MNLALTGGPQDRQNRHIFESLRRAERACAQLAAEGLTVLAVRAELARPIVTVEASPRCRRLPGAVKVRRQRAGQAERVWAAPFEGCQVEWTERGEPTWH